MVFGSAEHFDYLYSKLRHDDYVCNFYYNVLQKRVEVTFIPKKYKNVRSSTYITKDMWDDVYYRNYWLTRAKPQFLKALRTLESDPHFQISG